MLARPVADFSYDLNDFTVDFSDLSSYGHIYTWDFGDGEFSYDENPTHTYSQNGTYYVTLIVANDYCEDDITIEIEIMVTGIEDLELAGVEVYPVPFSDYLIVDFKEAMGVVVVELYDVKGVKLLEREWIGEGQLELGVEGVVAGIYELRVLGKDGVFVGKVVKF